MKRQLLTLVGLALVCSGFAHRTAVASSLSPEVLFQDSFQSFDLNFDLETRQSGVLAPIGYVDNDASDSFIVVSFGDVYLTSPPDNSYVAFSPNHNFTEGNQFEVQFQVLPGFDDPNHESSDWACVVVGSQIVNDFVISPTGLGILFRSNGEVQAFSNGALVYDGDAGFEGGLPKDRPFEVRIQIDSDGFNGEPAWVRMFIDGSPARLAEGEDPGYFRAQGFQANRLTFGNGAYEGIPFTSVFSNLSVSAVPSANVTPTSTTLVAGVESSPIQVHLPAQLTASQSVELEIRSLNPAVAVPTGADAEGRLVQTVAAGTSQAEFTVTGAGGGSTVFHFQVLDQDVRFSSGLTAHVASGVGLNEVLFRDTFDTSLLSWDINFEIGAPRQEGTAIPLGYVESASTAEGGEFDDLTQVNYFEYPGTLLLSSHAEAGNFTAVSPARNFIDGPNFAVEVDIVPGANLPDRVSTDWAALVLGASTQNPFVNAHNGLGINFRVNGQYEVWNGNVREYGNEMDNLLPDPPLRVRVEASAARFGAPVTLKLFVNDTQWPLSSGGAELVREAGFQNNYVSLLGYGDGFAHTFDNFTVTAEAFIHFASENIDTMPDTQHAATVRVPAAFIQDQSREVVVVASNPAMTDIAGAVDGRLVLTFPAGGSPEQSFDFTVHAPGATRLHLESESSVGVGEPMLVVARSALVRNPSFEQNFNPTWPHYGDIAQWTVTGGSGVNTAAGPFHDNGLVPDRAQVAFIQGTETLSQEIHGLVPDQDYWVQFYYNARNCCGGTIDLVIAVDGEEIDRVSNVQPVGGGNSYLFRNVPFTAPGSTVTLSFSGQANGDASLLLDAISVVARNEGSLTVQNPSFEASDEPAAPGVFQGQRMAGWVGTGSFGVNFSGAGPYADNGLAPDQDRVAFLVGDSSLGQQITRLTPGSTYTLRFAYNARSGDQPRLQVLGNDTVLWEESVQAVEGSNPYHVAEVEFTTEEPNIELTFLQIAEGDVAVLLDDIEILGDGVVLPCLSISPTQSEASISQVLQVSVDIPAALIGSQSATLQFRSSNPGVVRLLEADAEGIVSLTFDVGGSTSRTLSAEAVGRGSAQLEVVQSAGLCVETTTTWNVVGALVRNPSFEANPAGGFPGYSAVSAWTGGSGLNRSEGPFHDNGLIPDREQIAFIQGTSAMSQQIVGLVPGEHYWLQFHYNTRNCCDGGYADLDVVLDDVVLNTFFAVSAVGPEQPYHRAHLPFTAVSPTTVLEFRTTAFGDATILLDGVTILHRSENEPMLWNPSFEASGVPPFPGYLMEQSIAGWVGTGNYGINAVPAGPFADNGLPPDQDLAAILQNEASLSTVVSGLQPGTIHTVALAATARSGNAPILQIEVEGVVLREVELSSVSSGQAWPRYHATFTPAIDTAQLTVRQLRGDGDHSLAFDDVRVFVGEVEEPDPIEDLDLEIFITESGMIRVEWPSGNAVLHESDRIQGPWVPTTEGIEMIEGRHVLERPATGAELYLRLIP